MGKSADKAEIQNQKHKDCQYIKKKRETLPIYIYKKREKCSYKLKNTQMKEQIEE